MTTRNTLDRPEIRQALSGQITDQFVNGTTAATYGVLLEAALASLPLTTTVYNCTYSTISTTIIWLQERGTVIPADILATLGIEGINRA